MFENKHVILLRHYIYRWENVRQHKKAKYFIFRN